MAISEREIDVKIVPKARRNTKAKFVVVGSGDARVTKLYGDFLTKKLSIKDYFFCLSKGIVESVAYNAEKDRAHHIALLKKYICKKIDTVVIFTEVCCAEPSVTPAFLEKKEKRKTAAINAKHFIKRVFLDRAPYLRIECYLICILNGHAYLYVLDEGNEVS